MERWRRGGGGGGGTLGDRGRGRAFCLVQGPKSAHFPEHNVSILDFVLSMIELPHRNCSIAY